MQTLSDTLQAAIASGNPQRVLLEFTRKPYGTAYPTPVRFSNEDFVLSKGLKLMADFNSQTDLTIGLCPSAEIQFTLLNDAGQLENFEFGTFTAYIGAEITFGIPSEYAKTVTYTGPKWPGLYEFSPLGTFIAQRPDIVKRLMIDVDANDQMMLFEQDMPSDAALGISWPATLSTLFSKLCDYAGVDYRTLAFLNAGLSVPSRPEQFDSATMREVLGWIAEAACGNARFTRDGVLEIAWFNPVNKTYTAGNYAEFTTAWYQTAAIDGLHIRNADSTTEYVVGTGSNAYMIQDNPFLRQAASP